MTATPEMEPGEIARTLMRLERAVDGIRVDIASLDFVRADVWHVERDALVQRIAELESGQRWLVRLVLGIVISAVVYGVIVTGQAP